MSNVDTLRSGYEAFNRGDLEAAMADFDDGIRWENPNAQQLRNPGVTEGKDQVRQLFVEFGQDWDQLTVAPDEFVEQGDTVVVLGHLEGKASETGREVKLPFAHVWRFSDGRVQRVQALTDTALAAEALDRL
jgi:ketosteroid isomerase-like protein